MSRRLFTDTRAATRHNNNININNNSNNINNDENHAQLFATKSATSVGVGGVGGLQSAKKALGDIKNVLKTGQQQTPFGTPALLKVGANGAAGNATPSFAKPMGLFPKTPSDFATPRSANTGAKKKLLQHQLSSISKEQHRQQQKSTPKLSQRSAQKQQKSARKSTPVQQQLSVEKQQQNSVKKETPKQQQQQVLPTFDKELLNTFDFPRPCCVGLGDVAFDDIWKEKKQVEFNFPMAFECESSKNDDYIDCPVFERSNALDDIYPETNFNNYENEVRYNFSFDGGIGNMNKNNNDNDNDDDDDDIINFKLPEIDEMDNENDDDSLISLLKSVSNNC